MTTTGAEAGKDLATEPDPIESPPAGSALIEPPPIEPAPITSAMIESGTAESAPAGSAPSEPVPSEPETVGSAPVDTASEPTDPAGSTTGPGSTAVPARAILAMVAALPALIGSWWLAAHAVRTDAYPPFLAGAESTPITRYSGPWLTAAAGALLVAMLLLLLAVVDLVRWFRQVRPAAAVSG